MLETIKDALTSVQNEISNSVQKLRGSVVQNQQGEVTEAISSLIVTQAGSSLLLKFQLCIEQIQQMNDENIRAANLTSTRLGTLQQMCNERAQCAISVHDYFRSIPVISKQLKDLTQQIGKLNKFCQQTEQSMTYLEALQIVATSEKEISRLKSELKKEKNQFKQKEERERKWMQSTSPTSVRFTAASSSNSGDGGDEDDARNQSEVMILEEFLSS